MEKKKYFKNTLILREILNDKEKQLFEEYFSQIFLEILKMRLW
jgi:hypothetical protein